MKTLKQIIAKYGLQQYQNQIIAICEELLTQKRQKIENKPINAHDLMLLRTEYNELLEDLKK